MERALAADRDGLAAPEVLPPRSRSASAGRPSAAAVVEMLTGLELSFVVVLNRPTTASPADSTLAKTWSPALLPGVPTIAIRAASIESWSTLMT